MSQDRPQRKQQQVEQRRATIVVVKGDEAEDGKEAVGLCGGDGYTAHSDWLTKRSLHLKVVVHNSREDNGGEEPNVRYEDVRTDTGRNNHIVGEIVG